MIELPLQIIELEKDNYHLLIEGEFQDKKPSYWIIDTGASKSVFDINRKPYYEVLDSDNTDDYHSAGINQGMLDTKVGKLFYVKLGPLEIVDQKVALIDLNHINDIYEKYSKCRISGLLGGDILMKYKCVINYEARLICFTEE